MISDCLCLSNPKYKKLNLDRPTYSEAKEYFLSNKNYFEKLSGYYSSVDPEYYNRIFQEIENNINVKKYRLKKRIMNSFFMFFGAVFFLVYLFQFKIETDTNEFEIMEFSFRVQSSELSDFRKGINKFHKGQYLRAKRFFQNVKPGDENFSDAVSLITICSEKVDKEMLSENDEPVQDVEINIWQ